jgi:hypothetical protein
MVKDNIHYGDWEHRDVHNVNGMLFVSSHSLVFTPRFLAFDIHSLCRSTMPLTMP